MLLFECVVQKFPVDIDDGVVVMFQTFDSVFRSVRSVAECIVEPRNRVFLFVLVSVVISHIFCPLDFLWISLVQIW